MSHPRMSGQLQNSRTLNKIVYANQLGSIESGTNGDQVMYYTDAGIPTSSPNFSITQPSSGGPATVNLTGDLSVSEGATVEGTFVQGPNASTATPPVAGSSYLGWHNTGRYVEIAADTSNNAYIDFHSFDGNTGNDYDTRILSSGGGTGGVNGGGNLTIWANSTSVIGPERTFGAEGYTSYPPGLAIPGISQFRSLLTQKRVWSGAGVIGTSIRTTLTNGSGINAAPLVGKYSISMGMGSAGASIFSYEFYLFRTFPSGVFPLFDYQLIDLSRTIGGDGNNLVNFKAEIKKAIPGSPPSGPPQIWWTNNTAIPATYMVMFEGFVDDTGY